MAGYSNPNEYSWQPPNINQNYSFDTSNNFADPAQSLGKLFILNILFFYLRNKHD